MVSISLLYFEKLTYNATLYNNRKIFQRFETCQDIFMCHSVHTGGFSLQCIGVSEFWKVLYIDSRKFYLKLHLYPLILTYNATLYNNRKIFQRFETCQDIFMCHSVTEKITGLGIATYSETFSSHCMQS
jgi:hypothetical protein